MHEQHITSRTSRDVFLADAGPSLWTSHDVIGTAKGSMYRHSSHTAFIQAMDTKPPPQPPLPPPRPPTLTHTSRHTLRASLSGTYLQTLPDLVTPLKGHSLSPRCCPPTRSAPSERFGYQYDCRSNLAPKHARKHETHPPRVKKRRKKERSSVSFKQL